MHENYLTELSSADTKQANAALEALRIAGPETHLMSGGSGLWPPGRPRRCAPQWYAPAPLRSSW